MYYICEILRDVDGNITGWDYKYSSNKQHQNLSYDYVSLWSDSHESGTVNVRDDGSGSPELFEDPTRKSNYDREERLRIKSRRQAFGFRIIGLISDRNDTKDLTVTEIGQIETTYADIKAACISGSIDIVKQLVTAVTPDGDLITADDKTAILDEITANETALGY